jgi:hypothetical protein
MLVDPISATRENGFQRPFYIVLCAWFGNYIHIISGIMCMVLLIPKGSKRKLHDYERCGDVFIERSGPLAGYEHAICTGTESATIKGR